MADNLDPETLRQLNDSMREMRETVAGMVPAMVLMTAAMTENMNATRGNSNTTKNGKKLVDDFLKSQQEATAATESRAKADSEYAKVQANYKMANAQAIDGLKKFGNGLLTAGGGLTKYSSAVGSAGDAAMSIGKNFGLLGLAVGGLIKLFTMGAEMVLKQNEAMLKSADILADFGATGSLTTKELLTMANAAGYSSGEMEKFAGITKGLGTDIIGLSATVTGGVKAFAELATMDETLLANYRAMGVTQEQLNKNQADYIKLQIKSGMAISERDRQDGTLKRTTLEYTNYLLDLSAITGLSVDEAKKAQEIARADLAVQTRLALLQDKEEKLRSQGLTAQANDIKAERERTGALMDMAGTMFKGEELAGMQSMIATGNFNELSAGFASGAPEILEFIDAVKKGKKEPYELSLMMAQATKRTRENLGEAVIQNKEVGKSFAYSLEALKNEAKFRNKNPEEIKAIIEKEREVREKALKEGTTDPAKKLRNEQEQAERRARLGADAIVGLLNGPVTSAFEKLINVMNGVMKGMAIYSDKLFGTDLAKMFETPAEIAEQANKNAIALEEVTKKIEQTKKAMQQPEAYKEELLKQKKLTEDNYIVKAQETEKIRELYNKEEDAAKKGLLKQQLIDKQKEEQAAKQEADTAALNIRNAKFSITKEAADKKLLDLENQRNALTIKGNELDERLIKKELEHGNITQQEAAERRKAGNPEANQTSAVEARTGVAGTAAAGGGRGGQGGPTAAQAAQAGNPAVTPPGLGNEGKRGLKPTPQPPEGSKDINASAKPVDLAKILKFGTGSGSKENFEDLEPTFKDAVIAAATEYNSVTGKVIQINSAKRDSDKQKELYDETVAAGRPGFGPTGMRVGKPGRSLHEKGKAVDIQNYKDPDAIAAFNKQGLSQKVRDDPVHFQASGGAIVSGPKSGYPVEATFHGNEIVAPLDPNSIIAKMLTSTPEQAANMSNQNTVTTNSTPENSGITLEVFTMLSEKLDTMITMLSTSNDTQEQLLKYSRI
jgi:LAS superfamily LD-carboxypeptidase LdcB